MATKAQNLALIATLEDGGLNTAQEVRNVFTGFTNEIYHAEIVDTDTTTNVITKVQTGITYSVTFKKTGNTTIISGRVTNRNSFALNNVVLFDITNVEYRPSFANGLPFFIYANNQKISIFYLQNNVRLEGIINARATLFFTGTYLNNA